MGKMKVHELAKELNMQSKELVEKLIELKYDVKNHLSSLEDEDIEKIRKQFGKKQPGKKEQVKKEKKPIVPVIIRREVTRIVEEEPKKENIVEKKEGLGVVQRRTDTSMNIKYRTQGRNSTNISSNVRSEKKEITAEKMPTVKNEIRQENIQIKAETEQQAVETKNEIIENKSDAVALRAPLNKENYQNNNRPERRNFENRSYGDNRPNDGRNNRYNDNRQQGDGRNNRFNDNRQQGDGRNNRFSDNRQQGDGRNNRFNDNRQQGDGRNNRFNDNRQGSGDRPRNSFGNRNNFNRPNGEKKVEKGIKDIMVSTEAPTKEVGRENVRTAYKDKQKDSRKFEEDTKKITKTKTTRGSEEINYSKLKDLQSENKLSNMFDDTESKIFDYYDLSKGKGFKKGKKKLVESREHIEQKIFELKDIEIPGNVTVKELAEKLKKQSGEVIKKLLSYGVLATLNNELDFDTAYLVAGEFGVTAHKKEIVSDEEILFDETNDNEQDLIPRAPIVVVMGHVDHGKTSLLDAIRSTNVIEKEAGGITQHIGAYKVKINDREITFLDTPGHEAFTAMRARGAQVTDIAIIIVAADDGIKPQTVEAINHAKAANVSIIVAINKIDREGANVERVKQELMEHGLVPEEWGGDTICVPISAKQNKNIDSLLEMIILVADMKELKTNPNKQSKGTVLEARLDKNMGIIASVLVQRGTLNIGDTIVVGSVIGKIRGMTDDKGQKVKSAGPSTPVEITGLPEVPDAGEIFYEVENEKVAKHLIEKRKSKQREDMIRRNAPVTLDNLFNQIEQGKLRDLNIIVKADVQGSVQALRQSLEKIQNEEARVRIIHANVGGITESDITLAKVTNSIIIGFNVRPDGMAKSIADKEKVEIKLYSVIYNAIDDITAALKGMLKPKYREVIQGTAEVRQVFKITNVGMIAGCYVLDGKIVRNSGVRVIRDNVVIHEGKLNSLKREKDDSKEVAAGYECGVQVEEYNDIKVGDHIESFIMEEIK